MPLAYSEGHEVSEFEGLGWKSFCVRVLCEVQETQQAVRPSLGVSDSGVQARIL